MIAPEELRLGNLIIRELSTMEGSVHKTEEIIVEVTNITPFIGDNYSGIPLTEEWLVKAGFKNEYAQVYSGWIGDDIWGRIDFKVNIFCIISSGREAEESYLNHIKYVHQLQNLFHAISGEELEFKI